jgi:spoIIIJ-associated protein
MEKELIFAGTDENKVLDETLERLQLPIEAINYRVTQENDEELLPGAKPQLQVHVRIKPEYIADQAMDHLVQILQIMDIEADLEYVEYEGIVLISILTSNDASLLIGKDGQNIDALQYLISRMVLRLNREAPMLVIDIEDYRRMKFEKLKQLIERALNRARESGNEIELSPMPALERKFIHHYLSGEEGIRTLSRGEDPDRYIVLFTED